MISVSDIFGIRRGINLGTMKLLALEESFFERLDTREVRLDSAAVLKLQTKGFKEEKGFGPYTAVLTMEQNGEVRYQVDLYDERRKNEPDLPKFLAARKSFSSPDVALRNYMALVRQLPLLHS